jgi:hypothetical protein
MQGARDRDLEDEGREVMIHGLTIAVVGQALGGIGWEVYDHEIR